MSSAAEGAEAIATVLEATPLEALHRSLGAKMTAFAGFHLPLHFRDGILAEHRHTRSHASLFDVSHMGQADLRASASMMERIFPADIQTLPSLPLGGMRYTFLLNEAGGILDDLIIARLGEDCFRIIVNASRKGEDFRHIETLLGKEGSLTPRPDLALLALQGPEAARIVRAHADNEESAIAAMPAMSSAETRLADRRVLLFRSGYTGEDGFEIALSSEDAAPLAETLLRHDALAPAGLGARDSLRLEAGLCLYGSDMDETTSPIEAGLAWSIPKRRREDRAFPGAEIIARQIARGAARRRVGIRALGRIPARRGARLLNEKGQEIGEITSGAVVPDGEGLKAIAMAYLPPSFSKPGCRLRFIARGKAIAAEVAALPFRPSRTHRQPQRTEKP